MGGFIALTRDSPHSPPITTRINPRHSPARSTAQAHDWISTDPWTLHPSVWQSGYSAFSPAACKIPKQTTAYAANLTHSIRATSDGTILIFRKLPPLCETTTLHEPCVDWPSLEPLDLWKAFPELHFDQWISPGVILPQREWPDHILAPLSQRMDQAFSPSPLSEVETIFDKADDEEVLSAIESAAPSGPGAAACLRASLLSIRPQWISACLKSYPDMPETLQKMARTRVAWLEDRKAAAIAAWPDPFPHYDHIRASEDWNRWETSDFRVPFEQIRQSVAEVLTSHRVPDDATQQQLDAVFARLTGDEALQSLGKERYAAYCLDAAMAFAQTPSEAGRVQILSQLARTMGAPLAPCLRADALALTAQENYIAARDRWISLITHFPVSAHRAGDYSEAAYCAFENHDSRQAMALLATGTHRFPNDSSFALRAGWIALLTGHYESAWRFLGKGQQIGYEPEKMPHALAMLAIASFHSGAPDESAAYHTELLRIDPTWTHSETIESLGWPEEFTSTLLQLAESLPLTPDR